MPYLPQNNVSNVHPLLTVSVPYPFFKAAQMYMLSGPVCVAEGFSLG